MSTHPNERTIIAVEKIMEEMQYLVEHPRMQQRNWVEKGREWLPILKHAREDLERKVDVNDFVMDSYLAIVAVLTDLGLTVEKRDTTTWGYRWHNGKLTGAFDTQSQAINVGLRTKLDSQNQS